MSSSNPILSIVVVVYDMPEQALRMLRSLSPSYQRNVGGEDYEVIVVENESARQLGAERAESSGPNVRYFSRENRSSSPVDAVNFGVTQARGRMVGVMIDGARLLSPGVIELALLVHAADSRSLLSVPGYHIGSEPQQRAVHSGYDVAQEATLLASIDWPEDGYRLFDIAVLSASCGAGFFLPYAESNCLCLSRSAFDRLGGFDAAFVSRGGGYVNLDFYVRATELPDARLFVTPGEGTFHQFHGGVTTGGIREERDRLMEDIHDEYAKLRGHRFQMPTREALLIGRIPPNARRFVEESVRHLARRLEGQ